MSRILHGATSGYHRGARARAAIACGVALALADRHDVAARPGPRPPRPHRRRWTGSTASGTSPGSRTRSSAIPPASSTPTSSIRIATRSRIPRRTSSPAWSAVPAWLLTRNPYAAHNTALLFAFASTSLGTWLLARHLTGHSGAAAVAAILFAFCPYFFSHSAHIQLLMAGGIPLVDAGAASARGQRRRRDAALALGLALAAQALACAYYGIFAGLMVGYGVAVPRGTRRLWRVSGSGRRSRSRSSPRSLRRAAVLSALPALQREEGFGRSLDDAVRVLGDAGELPRVAGARASWLLPIARRWGWRCGEVLFPGLLALRLARPVSPSAVRSRRRTPRPAARPRDGDACTASLGVLAFWGSFGPAAGLYTACSTPSRCSRFSARRRASACSWSSCSRSSRRSRSRRMLADGTAQRGDCRCGAGRASPCSN